MSLTAMLYWFSMLFGVWKKPLILVSFVGFLNLFFFHSLGTTALTLVFTGLYVLFAFLLYSPQEKNHPRALLYTGLYLGLLLLFLITRGNEFVTFVISIGCVMTGITMIYLLATGLRFIRSLLEGLLMPLHVALAYLKSVFTILEKIFTQKPALSATKLQNQNFKSIIIGLAMGIPIVFALVTLLSGADPIYAKFIQNVFSFKLPAISERVEIRIIFSFFWFVVLLPFLYLKHKREFYSPLHALEKTHFVREMTVVMIIVAITLGSFIVIEAPYIFVNVPFETDLSQFGVKTYSEYVTRGFGELLFVSFFIYALIWLGLIFQRTSLPPLKLRGGQGELLKHPLMLVQLFVLAEFGIFIVSIFRRIWLYQIHHGWSLVRIYGGLFLIWLTAIGVTLLLRHFYTKRWIVVEAVLTMAMIAFVGLFNAEHFIATTHPPTVNKRIDYVYLSRMSTDGYEGWKKAYEYAEEVLVNRNLQQKELVNREERREVAYASLIVSHLTYQYYQLAQNYATQSEFSSVHKEILIHLKDLAVTQRDFLLSENATSDTELENTIRRLESQIEAVDSYPLKPYTPSFSTHKPRYALLFNESQSNPCFWHTYLNRGLICNTVFYWSPDTEGVYKYNPTTIDKLFVMNWSNASAYQRMKREIPITKLLQLQTKYYQLYSKITHQSPSERDYDIDISFRTPFL